MEIITNEIEHALKNGLYYLALVCTLSLPDVCAALESLTGETTARQYRDWYDRWLRQKYPQVTGDDLYGLRCGVVHQGQLAHPKSQYSRIVFILPNAQRGFIHRVIVDDVLHLYLVTFCTDMVTAVTQWYAAKQNDANVIANFSRLVQYRPQGLAPYIEGVPLIA
jgi:hypothetical protein